MPCDLYKGKHTLPCRARVVRTNSRKCPYCNSDLYVIEVTCECGMMVYKEIPIPCPFHDRNYLLKCEKYGIHSWRKFEELYKL